MKFKLILSGDTQDQFDRDELLRTQKAFDMLRSLLEVREKLVAYEKLDLDEFNVILDENGITLDELSH